nr:pyrimidine/purine nucleoside phosphorylase [Cerasicoccus maritimus]
MARKNGVAISGRRAEIGRMFETFDNVQILKKANVYFDGKVTSRTVVFADGTKKTLGFMQAGDYEFGTEAPELMEMLGGEMEVRLDGSEEWKTYTAGDSFDVPGSSKFFLKVKDGGADYCCSYLS